MASATGCSSRTPSRGKKYRSDDGHLRRHLQVDPHRRQDRVGQAWRAAGYSGYSDDPRCVTHLHFQLFDPRWRTVDPYGIYSAPD